MPAAWRQTWATTQATPLGLGVQGGRIATVTGHSGGLLAAQLVSSSAN